MSSPAYVDKRLASTHLHQIINLVDHNYMYYVNFPYILP